jgi:hypothetical protein
MTQNSLNGRKTLLGNTNLLQTIIRGLGLLLLAVGLLVWCGSLGSLIPVHVCLGGMLTLALFAVLYSAHQVGVSKRLIALGVVWYSALPVFGLAHAQFFAASDVFVKISQISHVLCAFGAIGLAEVLAGQTRRKVKTISA